MSNPSDRESRKNRRIVRKESAQRQAKRRRQFTVIGAISVALIVALALIIIPQLGGSGFGTIQVANASAAGLPSNGNVLGDPNAPVKVVEFGNYQCPYCGIFARQVQSQLITDYVKTGKASFEFRDFAFGGQESSDAAAASQCANDQGKFWQMHDTLYLNQHGENQGAFTRARLKEIAQSVGLDMSKFNQCLDSDAHAKDVQNSSNAAINAGAAGTPTFEVDGKIISYNGYGSLQAAINAALGQ
ncbi:MAG TPA: thioredoxin domain-containing protein [Nitrolancea sp.]|nr:thioredoxin domain-containing protein [Nitrolancea sp.]